jgi:hypothetical protein
METDSADGRRPEQALPSHRHPWFIEENRDPLPMLFDAEGYPVIQFDPVPQARRRRVGWDEDRQRAFIALLARVPSVARAAKAMGMSARSAYKLLDRPGAEQFSRAWDMAIDFGMEKLRGETLHRCLDGGDFVPVFHKGRLVRVDFRRNDRLAVAILSGKDRDIDSYRRSAQSRSRQKREWEAFDGERAAAEAAREQARLDYLRQTEEFVAANPGPRPVPRIRAL